MHRVGPVGRPGCSRSWASAIPLVGTRLRGLAGRRSSGSWSLGFVWLFGRHLLLTRAQRIVAALVALPVLFLLAFEGGWWLSRPTSPGWSSRRRAW